MSETKDNKQRNAEIHPEEGGSADSGQKPANLSVKKIRLRQELIQ